jgi:hypothetical protein
MRIGELAGIASGCSRAVTLWPVLVNLVDLFPAEAHQLLVRFGAGRGEVDESELVVSITIEPGRRAPAAWR